MKEPRPYTATEVAIANPVIRVMSRLNTFAYRLTGGRLFGKWLHGEPIVLLTVTGRKSGRKLTVPLIHLPDGDRMIVVASKGGMDKHPLWYLNLVTNPRCEVEIGSERRSMVARQVSAEAKAALWPRLCTMYPDYADYQARTSRDIPVLRLTNS